MSPKLRRDPNDVEDKDDDADDGGAASPPPPSQDDVRIGPMDDGRPSHDVVFPVIGTVDCVRIGGGGWESAEPTAVAYAVIETGRDRRPPTFVSR